MSGSIREDKLLNSYIATALWSSPDIEESEHEFLDCSKSIDDVEDKTLEFLNKELVEFINKYYHLVRKTDVDTTKETFAHMFWLTRNGHGSGFWDGSYKNGDELSDACDNYPAISLLINDDGKVYAS